MTKIVLFFIILFSSFSLYSQKYEYDIVKSDKVIGDMTAERTKNGNRVVYHIESVTNFRMLVNLRVDFVHHEEYLNGLLDKGYAHSQLNGVTQKKSDIVKKGDHYYLERESFIDKFYEEIEYSIPEIYFEEPVNREKVFSQVFGKYLYFEKIDDHTYTLDSDDGLNEYKYKNGKCVEVKINRSYALFYIRLRN